MDQNQEWYACTDEEYWSCAEGPYPSREDAIQGGTGDLEDGDAFYVGRKVPFEPRVSGDSVIERIRDDAYEAGGEHAEDYLDKVTPEQEQALTSLLTSAFKTWFSQNGFGDFFLVEDIQYHIWGEDDLD